MKKQIQTMYAAMGEKLGLLERSRGRVANASEPANMSASATASTVQGAIRAAEAGDTRPLFALYRDLMAGGSHIQAEFNKRKLALLAQPHAILPADPKRPEDATAVLAVQQMIADCENWSDGLTHLLDSALWPVAVAEKIFRARNRPDDLPPAVPLQFTLRRLAPVNPTLLCFQSPGARDKLLLAQKREPAAVPAPAAERDLWEPDLRFWAVDEAGRINYAFDQTYGANAVNHLVHRGHLLVGQRDNWGGPMRAVVAWWLLAVLGRDWFARAMERFGNPFPVGYTNTTDPAAIEFLNEAFSLATKIGGLVVDHETRLELKEVAVSGLADAHEKFLSICNREISKVIVGQTLSSEAQSTGLGSGVADLHAEVREDIRMFDQIKLGEVLQKQLFAPFLKINGLRGAPPKIVWGGLSDTDAKLFADLLDTLSRAGFEPTDEAMPTTHERLGFTVQRKGVAAAAGANTTNATADAPAAVREFGALLPPNTRARLATFRAQSRMADNLGVPAAWLNPLRDFLEGLQAKAADESLSDQDLLDFLDEAIKRVPELFQGMDIEALAEVFEAGMADAVVEGTRRGLRNGVAPKA